MPDDLETSRVTIADLDHILENFLDFWDHEEPKVRHHPMFVRELGDCSLALRDGSQLVAYLLGLVSSNVGDDGKPWAYVHMVAVRRSHRRQGLAERLYRRFIELARSRGCSRLRATASPTNRASYAFHTAIGMKTVGDGEVDGVQVTENYFGPGNHRVLFELDLQPSPDEALASA